ncbi:MAG: peptidylprolyl isomerase [Gemmatimonadaceae bacterium]|nr:peptidylprolyl isomerase [Gemmatimonadaceae bacterium]
MLLPNLFAVLAITAVTSVSAAAQAPSRAPSAGESSLYARLLAMTDARVYDAVLVDSALASSWAPMRAAAALGVGQLVALGKPGAAKLRSLLVDRDLVVASNAAYALGLLVDSVGVSALANALTGPPRVAREAAWALGEIGGPARPFIVAALATPGTDEARMIQLLLAAVKMRPVPVPELRPYLRMTDRPSVQWAAAYAIARGRVPAGVRDLIALATSPAFLGASATQSRPGAGRLTGPAAAGASTAEPYVSPQTARQRARAEIARGLAQSAAGDSLADESVAVLLRLASDPHPHVRINAVRSLATYGARGRDVVVAATRDADPNVRIATAQVLATVLDSAAATWTSLWQRDTSLMYRASLLASAARSGAKLPAMTGWLSHRDWRLRVAALSAAGAAPNPQLVRETARGMLRDSDPRVRSAAYGALSGADTVALPPLVRDILLAGLADADVSVRETVLGILARHPRQDDVPAVIAAYARETPDTASDARIAAIAYLAAAWRKDSASFSRAFRDQIAAMRPSDDPLARAAAKGVSLFAGWPPVSGNRRPAAWYEDVVKTYVVPALRGRLPQASIRTNRGTVVLELFAADAPITVQNFATLARRGYYRDASFHRVVPNFVAQDGDPRGTGNGGPGYAIRDEMNPRRYDRGALGMALSGPDTGGSQYFITHSPQPHLDGHYTVFGRVLRGHAVLDAIVQGDPILAIVIE